MKKIAILSACFLSLIIGSCSKKWEKSDSFTVKGTLVYADDSTVVPGRGIVIEFDSGEDPFLGKERLKTAVGSGSTGSTGDFEISCDYYEPGFTYSLLVDSEVKRQFQPARSETRDLGLVFVGR
jgi:hypothetical protein